MHVNEACSKDLSISELLQILMNNISNIVKKSGFKFLHNKVKDW